MRFAALVIGLLATFVSSVAATALTYRLEANEKACFYNYVDQRNVKLAFYFAVQSGGSFDIDYSVVGPGEKVVLDGTKERQGDFVFTAQSIGEYRFCFNNDMSTFAEKIVDFEIAVENEERAQLPSRQGASPEQASALEESIFKLSAQLSTITRNQKYFRTRENRNFSTVRSTERRIFNFSVIEGLMMVSMAALQVFVVRFFFQGARKGKYNKMATAMHDDEYHSMPPTSGEGCRPPGDHLETGRAADPNSSVEDYSRVMLEYTQRRMADFADLDDGKGSSRSSRSSQTSGNSGTSTSGMLARQAAGTTGAAHDSSESAKRESGVNSADLSF
ncbi:endosomal cargo receptor [Aspergillus eucalypticola CBS 122712]|uniref:Endosomal cargo receptor n=1 Tax=Aspergillus eucalypticola (strain CBS 122712 / IBT 29274) TaxID=1448314 RepID=A0A317VKB7_ASPEC|nr:endosomal cargo receptor [Aspergillus eucalypticola CBS 122712]PWY74753.1 endosomal cargo receptor [Aspergillus eucalypticola CBS 122712]